MSKTPVVQRLRITFGKHGALRYTSNLDIAKVWERVLRRADLPILYTQGFNTRPRIQLAIALPLGITSDCELLDVAMREVVTLDGLAERLQAVSPPGLVVHAIDIIPPEAPALETYIDSAEYHINFPDGIDQADIQRRIDALLAQERIVKVEVNRKGKKSVTDIRTLIYDVRLENENTLWAHLAVGTHGNIRPDDLLKELGLDNMFVRIHRTKLHINNYTPR